MKTWLTVAEAAEYAGVSRDTIYTACERAELQHARISGRRAIRLKREWIDAWLEQHTRAAFSARTNAGAPINAVESTRYPGVGFARTRTINTGSSVNAPSMRSSRGPQRECDDGC